MNKTFAIIVGGLILIIGSFIFANSYFRVLPNPDITPLPVAISDDSTLTIKGEIACLPKKGDGPQTMECAIGLKDEDNNYYALKNLFENDPEYKFSNTDMQVEVFGIYKNEVSFGPDGNVYDIVGSIEVTSIKEIFGIFPPPVQDGKEEIILQEGQKESSFLLEKISTTSVSGLNFWEYPVATEEGHFVTLKIGEIVSNGCTITLELVRIEGDTAVFLKETDFNKICPICLAGNTQIETPLGLVTVKNLKIGTPVWTTNSEGKRVYGTVEKISKTLVPESHKMVHLILNNGRELFVSSGHPTADGRIVGDLMTGDFYDGYQILTALRVPYSEEATYDLLPSGETGFYWANGILLGSTLSQEK